MKILGEFCKTASETNDATMIRRCVRSLTWIVSLLVYSAIVFSMTSRDIEHLSDQDILLPPYFFEGLREGITGTLTLEVNYRRGKVESVKLVSSDLTSKTDFATEFPLSMKAFTKRLISTVESWENSIRDTFSTTVSFQFNLDETLPPTTTNYLVERGQYGAVTRVVMTGSVQSKR